MRIGIIAVIGALLFFACTDENALKIDVSHVNVDSFSIKRYEKEMFSIPNDSFISATKKLQNEFPVFLEGNTNDTAAVLMLKSFFQDPYMRELNALVQEKYPNLNALESQLLQAYKYFKHYFPELKTPQTYTYVSGLDAEFPVKYAIDNLIIGIDMYLGSEAKPYKISGFPVFRSHWMREDRIVCDCMEEIASGLLPEYNASGTLLDDMIYRGKILYFTQATIPEIQDSLLLKYNSIQIDYCNKYEAKVWSLIIESNFLFDKNPNVKGKFMKDGPYSTFLAKESPARMGYYIGWRIVSEYMKNSGSSIKELFNNNDSQQILKESKFRPKIN